MIQQNYGLPCHPLLQREAKSATNWLVFGETKTTQIMTDARDASPDDIGVLQALLDAARAERDAAISERDRLAVLKEEKLEAIIVEMRRAQFGRKSERISADQQTVSLGQDAPFHR